MISARLAIDIVFVALVILAVVITAIIVAKVLTDYFSLDLLGSRNEVSLVITDPATESQPKAEPDTPPRSTLPIPPDSSTTDENADPKLESTEDGSMDGEGGQFVEVVYSSSPVILPVTWGAVLGTVIWRGKVRSEWSKQGYDYDTFRLVTKMRGSSTRQRLLDSLKAGQRNKLQLAREFGVDWKTIDNHIEMLVQSGLVEEKMMIGTARYYGTTKRGKKVLSLLSNEQTNVRDGKDGTA